MSLGAPELVIVLVILLLLFGAKKLPNLASSMGKSIKEFRQATEGATTEAKGDMGQDKGSGTNPQS